MSAEQRCPTQKPSASFQHDTHQRDCLANRLSLIAGKPMIQHTVEQARRAKLLARVSEVTGNGFSYFNLFLFICIAFYIQLLRLTINALSTLLLRLVVKCDIPTTLTVIKYEHIV
jgi:GTP:adenosylcobinamide-phosphate guanylyltransferase